MKSVFTLVLYFSADPNLVCNRWVSLFILQRSRPPPKGVHLHRMNGTKNELLCNRPPTDVCNLLLSASHITPIQSRGEISLKRRRPRPIRLLRWISHVLLSPRVRGYSRLQESNCLIPKSVLRRHLLSALEPPFVGQLFVGMRQIVTF